MNVSSERELGAAEEPAGCGSEKTDTKIFRDLGAEEYVEGSIEHISLSAVEKRRSAEHKKVNVWRINHRLLILGQCWNNRTEFFSKRNNEQEAIEFLSRSYEDRYMVWSSTGSFKGHPNVQRIPLLDFDVSLAVRVSTAVRCWLDLNQNNVAVFELKNSKEEPMRFLIDCVMRNCDFSDMKSGFSEDLTASIFGSSIDNIGTIRRYVEYFVSALGPRHRERQRENVLKQLIITTVPKIPAKEFVVGIKISQRSGDACRMQEDKDRDRVYVDDDYIIFSDVSCKIADDVRILVYYRSNGQETSICRLCINSIFYTRGLYRFGLGDIECMMQKRCFDPEFSVDLAIEESGPSVARQQHPLNADPGQGFRILMEDFNREPDPEEVKRLVEAGHNPLVARFCSLMGYENQRAAEFIKELMSRGYRNPEDRGPPRKVTNISLSNNREEAPKHKEPRIQVERPNVAEKEPGINRSELYSLVEYQPRVVRPIPENLNEGLVPEPKKATAPKKILRGVATGPKPSVVVKKPLYWVPLTKTEETIFAELSKIDAEIDYGKFEDMFCEPLVAQDSCAVERTYRKATIDPRRMFLVSLSLRHLELKGLSPENIPRLVLSFQSSPDLQDLLNIRRVYPTHEELLSLGSVPPESLSEVELMMLQYSQLPEVQKVLEILIFEKNFVKDMLLLENTIHDLLRLFNGLLDSYGLRMVIKVILEIGNAVNFKYSARRKKAHGFKLASLYALNTYRGKNNASLFPFLIETLERNEVRIEEVLEEISLIHSLKSEDLSKIREKINEHIRVYDEQLETLASIEGPHRKEYQSFFGYACKKLEEVSASFRECCVHGSLVRRKFGEEENKSMNEILGMLSDFMCNLGGHYYKKAGT
jgi:hypothetical protein